MAFNETASKESVEKAMASLKANGFETEFVETGADAKKRVFELLPEGAQVMNMTSVTLETIGVVEELSASGKYKLVKDKLANEATSADEKRMLGAAPEWTVGSAHAVTEDGHIIIASNTGSQLPAYAYGAAKVVWVISTAKVVKDFEMALKRIYEYTLPLESERANKAYGITTGSFVSKMLVMNREIQKDRIHVILVNEVLGF